MKTFKSLLVGIIALGAVTIAAPPAQADSHRHRYDRDRNYSRYHYGHRKHSRYHRPARVVYYNGPRYYRSSYYYAPRPYRYYRPYYYDRGPSLTIAFGGHRHRW